MSNRFDYVKYDDATLARSEAFKEMFVELAGLLEISLTPGRAQSLALTKLEESFMWVGKALRDEQVNTNKKAQNEKEST